jgi:hypothetical protein
LTADFGLVGLVVDTSEIVASGVGGWPHVRRECDDTGGRPVQSGVG